MSFEWNFSSDEDDNDMDAGIAVATEENKEERSKHDEEESHATTTGDDESNYDNFEEVDTYDDDNPGHADPRSRNDWDHADFLEEDENDDDDDDDEDGIDWEDAGGKEERPPPTARTQGGPTTAVTINFGTTNPKKTIDDDDDNSKHPQKKRGRSRTTLRYRGLDAELRRTVELLHQASLVCWTGHAILVSRYTAEDEALGLAHSLLSTAWLEQREGGGAASSRDEIGNFLSWFTHFVGTTAASSLLASGRSWVAAPPTPSTVATITPTGRRQKRRHHRNRDSTYESRRKTGKPPDDATTVHYRLPEYCAQLATTKTNARTEPSYDLSSFNDYDRLLLFLSMVRSMGWRARYVVAVEPIARDLDVDHPLFHSESNANVVQKICRYLTTTTMTAAASSTIPNVTTGGDKSSPIMLDEDDDDNNNNNGAGDTSATKPAAVDNGTPVTPSSSSSSSFSPKKTSPNYPASLYHNNGAKHACWVEILCRSQPVVSCSHNRRGDCSASKRCKPSKTIPTMQWIMCDPILGIYDQPNIVERVLLARKKNVPVEQVLMAANQKKNRRPITYALAVEHRAADISIGGKEDDHNANLLVRMTDVTRRYASSMVDTMEARGTPQRRTQPESKRRRRRRRWSNNGTSNLRRRHHDSSYSNATIHPEDEEQPDEWWSTFLKRISNPNHQRSRPPNNAKLYHQSNGKTCQDAIALDESSSSSSSSSDDEMNRKPVAVDPLSLKGVQSLGSKHDREEGIDEELELAARKEPLPTSKAAFKKHPMYVLRSVLNSTAVLKPDAKKRVCGMFKGELVFQRSDVETALSEKRWLYEGRKVHASELNKPILKVKARKKPSSTAAHQFQALATYGVGTTNDGSAKSRAKQIEEASKPDGGGDGKTKLYGSWQTAKWSPPRVSPNDPIPVNCHKNIELELLNPGLVHVELRHVAKVAKKLGLPYAPCMLGFERSNKPNIRGIVIHEHNEELLREAQVGMADFLLQQEYEAKRRDILLKWKRLLVGVLTKDRLEREYGDDSDDE